MDYMKMLAEYKQTEIALKNRIEELAKELESTFGTKERTGIIKRKIAIERELDDLECAIYEINKYTEREGMSKCRNV